MPHRGRLYGELHAPDQVLRCEGSPRGKEGTEGSKTIGIRCTHGETNSCTRSYAAARKDYCALESGQQAAGRPGSARFATEGCTCSAKTRGKAGQKRGLALGHITTEQPATDAADRPGGPDVPTPIWFCFQPKKTREKKTRTIEILWRIGFSIFTFAAPGSSRYRRATLAIELGGRSNLPKWTFPISWRFVPSLFCYASAFHFHLEAPGCYASD